MDLDTWQSKLGVGSSRSVPAVPVLSVTGFTLPCKENVGRYMGYSPAARSELGKIVLKGRTQDSGHSFS